MSNKISNEFVESIGFFGTDEMTCIKDFHLHIGYILRWLFTSYRFISLTNFLMRFQAEINERNRENNVRKKGNQIDSSHFFRIMKYQLVDVNTQS